MSVLDGLKYVYTLVDICQDQKDKDSMRKIVGDCKALPPQICNGDTYCGVSLTQYLAKGITGWGLTG